MGGRNPFHYIIRMGECIMFSFNSRIRFSEVNEKNQLDFASIINYFQDLSMFHSEEMGLGLEFFKEKKRAWLLNSWQINVKRFPTIFEDIKISTYPYLVKGFMGYRNFTITDKQDNLCVIADSSWIYVDIEKNRPVRALEEEIKPYGIDPKLEMNYIKGRILVPENMKTREAFEIMPSYIDSNHHVNNGQYVKLAENFLMSGFQANQLRVEYRKAAKLHDIIYPAFHVSENTNIICLNNESGKPYAIIEFSNTGGL